MNQSSSSSAPNAPASDHEPPLAQLVARSLFGGTLMGLANLVPGISGGTMLLASGIYTAFVEAIADLTRLRFRKQSLVVLASVVAAAGLAILLLAGPVKTLVVEQRWVMYSLFIGLTLGGIPIVWGLLPSKGRSVWVSAAFGFLFMAALALLQSQGGEGQGREAGFLFMLFGGIAGASAMILPGVSGGYLLLVMGLYVPILAGIDQVKSALKAMSVGDLIPPVTEVVIPVGLGVVIGVIGVSNLLKFLLARFEAPTLGVLLGLLAGAVLGLWPFQQGVRPKVGDVFKGQTLDLQAIEQIPADKWPTAFFEPSMLQVAGAIGLIALGFGITQLIARFGQEKPAA